MYINTHNSYPIVKAIVELAEKSGVEICSNVYNNISNDRPVLKSDLFILRLSDNCLNWQSHNPNSYPQAVDAVKNWDMVVAGFEKRDFIAVAFNGRKIKLFADGHAELSCGEVISREDMNAIIVAREKAKWGA